MNGIYDFGWLRAEGGVVMPPSDRLEETGALATMVDENQFSYSLEALCARYGLPGKDETCLRQAVEAAGFAPRRREDQSPEPHLAIAGALRRPVRRGRRGRIRLRCLRSSIRSWIGRNTATPIGSKSICCRWCWKCAAAAFALIRTPPSRRAICCSAKRDAALAELSSQLGAPVGMDEINGREMEGKGLRAIRHQLSAHRRRAIRSSRPANPAGWQRIRTGCRS